MLRCEPTFEAFTSAGVTLFTGVPDSLLKAFCAYVADHTTADQHVITANEGSAVGLAVGHYLASRQLSVVYMQNSGLGNSINPLTSLADSEVYGVPMLVVVGWRGEPGKKDEPQHVKMGRITRELLHDIDVPFEILADDQEQANEQIDTLANRARNENRPVALLVRKGIFEPYQLTQSHGRHSKALALSREQALELVLSAVPGDVPIVSTTGMPSRELFELRDRLGSPHDADFLTVGSMGHCSQIALGAALRRPQRDIVCIDGDGAVIMHMGGLATVGSIAPPNFKHVVVNNGAHDSVGGQPTVGFDIDIRAIATACGYRWTAMADSVEATVASARELLNTQGPALLEIRVRTGARADLGRPTLAPVDTKRAFMRFLEQ